MRRNDVDIKEILKQNWEIFDSKYDGVFTKTTQFMLASLEINLTATMLKCFRNAFLKDVEHDHEYERPIFLLFGKDDEKNWKRMHEDLTKNSNFVNDYVVGFDKNGIELFMYVFSVPEKFKDDYYSFKSGRYSKFSESYKSKFAKFISVKNKREESIVWQVIHKADTLRRKIEDEFSLEEGFLDAAEEIWEQPRKEREYYNYKK